MFFLANYGKLWRENLDILQPTNFPMSNWVFPKMGIPNLDGFIMENPIKVDDFGYHYFRKHPNLNEPSCGGFFLLRL